MFSALHSIRICLRCLQHATLGSSVADSSAASLFPVYSSIIYESLSAQWKHLRPFMLMVFWTWWELSHANGVNLWGHVPKRLCNRFSISSAFTKKPPSFQWILCPLSVKVRVLMHWQKRQCSVNRWDTASWCPSVAYSDNKKEQMFWIWTCERISQDC